jgi:mannose-6-phosphate isomerase-like protein (cupin superfamily)
MDNTDPMVTVMPTDLRDWVDFSPDEARCVRVLATPSVAVDIWCIEPQQATEVLMDQDVDRIYTVIGGRSWFVTDQGEVGLDPMGAVLIPRGVAHGIQNRGVDPLIVHAAVSPGGNEVGEPTADLGLAIRDDRPRGLSAVLRSLFGDAKES